MIPGAVHPSIPATRCGVARPSLRGRSRDRRVHAGSGSYDRSVCAFPTEAEYARSLQHLAGLLDRGGWLVFGIDDWPPRLPAASTRREDTERGVERVEVAPDLAAMTCTHRVSLVRPDGRLETHALTRRHYSVSELETLLARCGFALAAAFHRLAEERPYVEGGDGLFVYARRGGEARSPGT